MTKMVQMWEGVEHLLTAGGYVNGYSQCNKDGYFSESRNRSTMYSVIPGLGICPKDSIS